jgi:hypothetical protein
MGLRGRRALDDDMFALTGSTPPCRTIDVLLERVEKSLYVTKIFHPFAEKRRFCYLAPTLGHIIDIKICFSAFFNKLKIPPPALAHSSPSFPFHERSRLGLSSLLPL